MNNAIEKIREYDEGLYLEISRDFGYCLKCGKPILKGNYTKRKYCSDACGNAHRVMQYRKRKKTALPKVRK